MQLQNTIGSLVENTRRRCRDDDKDMDLFLSNLSNFSSNSKTAKMCAKNTDANTARRKASLAAIACQEGSDVLRAKAMLLFEVKSFKQYEALGHTWKSYCEDYLLANVENVNAFIHSFMSEECCGGEIFNFNFRCETPLGSF